MADILFDEHPDVQYLLNEKISMVLSQALAETYEHQPTDPVEFFSKYLLHHIDVREQANQVGRCNCFITLLLGQEAQSGSCQEPKGP